MNEMNNFVYVCVVCLLDNSKFDYQTFEGKK